MLGRQCVAEVVVDRGDDEARAHGANWRTRRRIPPRRVVNVVIAPVTPRPRPESLSTYSLTRHKGIIRHRERFSSGVAMTSRRRFGHRAAARPTIVERRHHLCANPPPRFGLDRAPGGTAC